MFPYPRSLEFLQSRTLPGLVQEEIVRLVKVGEFQAGEKLNEAEIASKLMVSRATLREAFRGLEESGLLMLSKNRGAFIRDISEREAKELYEVRAGLDEMAGRLLVSALTSTHIRELRGMLEREGQILDRGETNEYFSANIAFHDRIVEMSGNLTLLRHYRRVIDLTYLLRRYSLRDTAGLKISIGEHQAIVKALASRDVEAVASSMRDHVMSGHQRMWSARWGRATTTDGSRPAEAARSAVQRRRKPTGRGKEIR